MAKLPEQTLTTIFNLQRRLVQLIDEAKATEWALFGRHGETDETIPELDQLQNVAQRLRNPYLRLYTLLLSVSESQPVASTAILNLLAQTISDTQAIADASQESIREIKIAWDLP